MTVVGLHSNLQVRSSSAVLLGASPGVGKAMGVWPTSGRVVKAAAEEWRDGAASRSCMW